MRLLSLQLLEVCCGQAGKTIAWTKSLPGGHGGSSIESWPGCSREHSERKAFRRLEEEQLNPGRGSDGDDQLTDTGAEEAEVLGRTEVPPKKLIYS